MKIDKGDVLALVMSGILSFFAYVEANNKPKTEVIVFTTPIVITANR